MNRLVRCCAAILVFTVGLLTVFQSAFADSEPGYFGSLFRAGYWGVDPLIFSVILFGLIVLVLAGIAMLILYILHRNKNKHGN